MGAPNNNVKTNNKFSGKSSDVVTDGNNFVRSKPLADNISCDNLW